MPSRVRKIIVVLLYFGSVCTAGFAQHSGYPVSRPDVGAMLRVVSNMPDTALLTNYMQVVRYYYDIDNDSSVFYAMQGLRYFKDINYKRGQARMVLELANYDDTHGNSAPASEKLQFAIGLFAEAGDSLGLADAYDIAGVVEAKKGDFAKSIYYFIEAEKIYISLRNKTGLFNTWLNLGLLYDNNNDSEKLFYYYSKADSLSSQIPLSENVIALYNNIGASYTDHHDIDKGLAYVRKALQLSDTSKYLVTHLVCLMSMGELYLQTGKSDSGKAYLDQALLLARQHNLPDQEAGIFINFVLELGPALKQDTAIRYLNNALALVAASGNLPRKLAVYNTFEKLYEYNKNYAEAVKYLKLSHALSDSMFNMNKSKQIANVAAVYDLKLSNDRIKQLEDLDNKNRRQKRVILFIAGLLWLLMGILYLFYRKTRNLNLRLHTGKKELAELNAMKDKLFSIIGHDLRGPIGNFPVIIDMLNSEAGLPDEYRDTLATLKEQTSATSEILEKLLLFGKSTLKGQNYNPVLFDTKTHIANNIEMLTFTANRKHIEIVDNTPQQLKIDADTAHFDFIVRNLLSNAIKFSFNGGRVTIEATKDAVENMILFTVSDEGAGIGEDALKTMFTATVSSTYGTAQEKGTGIGLMLCQEFVLLNGGKIGVESMQGKGAKFYFTMRAGK